MSTSEPLKSVTLLRLSQSEEPPLASDDTAGTAVPFHLAFTDEDLSNIICCPTRDGSLIILPNESVPHKVHLPVPPSVLRIEKGTNSSELVVLTSSSAHGAQISRVAFQVNKVTGVFDVSPGHASVVSGGRNRGFEDGSRETSMFHSPSIASMSPVIAGQQVLAVADKGNFAIRFVNMTAGDGYGSVRTVCGCGVPGYCDGVLGDSMLREVTSLMWTSRGDLLFSDGPNHAVRILRRRHRVEDRLFLDDFESFTLIGGNTKRQGCVDGPLPSALIQFPSGMAPAATDGILILADTQNNAIRVVDTSKGEVTTLVGLADYQSGSPVPHGLMEPTQVLALKLRDGGSSGDAHAILCVSQKHRAMSMIVPASLPLPSRKTSSAGILSVGSLYNAVDGPFFGSFDDNLLRSIRLTKPPASARSPNRGRRHHNATYAELEAAKIRRDQAAKSRNDASQPAALARQQQKEQRNAASDAVVDGAAAPSTGGTLEGKSIKDSTTMRHFRVIYEAHATRGGADSGSEEWSMKILSFWNFCVTADLIVNTTSNTSSYEYMVDLYQKSWQRDGYKVVSTMPFPAFVNAILKLYFFNNSDSARREPSSKVDEHHELILSRILHDYCTNSQSSLHCVRQSILDVMTVNEPSLIKIFRAYANTVERKCHMNHVPYLRFQSLIHMIRVYPALISQYRLKQIFSFACECSFLVPPREEAVNTKQVPSASKDSAETIAAAKKRLETTCRDKALNEFQFVEALARVAWVAFSSHAKHNADSDAGMDRVCFSAAGDGIVRAVDALFRWINVEMESMLPSTEVAERNRQGNNEACAVFPPRTPLFVTRASSSASPQRETQSEPRSESKDHTLKHVDPSQSESLEKDLRRLRRMQDSVEMSSAK